MADTSIRSLASAITLQAVRDYFAEQLVKNPAEIKARLKKHHKYGA